MFVDRKSTRPNRYKITPENGESYYVTIERADEPTVEGTALNAAVLNQLFKKLSPYSQSDENSMTLIVTSDHIFYNMDRTGPISIICGELPDGYVGFVHINGKGSVSGLNATSINGMARSELSNYDRVYLIIMKTEDGSHALSWYCLNA